ncbi:MAG: hypothetical protein K6T65_12185 [Peptococcaceae bacterium]|nr:hypothetical protein [Peptococcaceae bacterium]
MTGSQGQPSSEEWVCLACGAPMSPGKVIFSYMGSDFPIELIKCHGCGLVFVPEDLATGKMAEVEKVLEDK